MIPLIRSSLFIQAADTYLHVAIDAVDLIQAQMQPSLSYGYSRGLTPWCLNRPTAGSFSNANYWGCGLYAGNEPQLYTTVTNDSEFFAIGLGFSNIHTNLDYIDADGTFTAILAPKNVPTGVNYYASTFGVSMECQPIRNSSCLVTATENRAQPGTIYQKADFNCSDPGLGIHLSGNIYGVSSQVYQFDFHRFIHEPPPFTVEENTWSTTQNMLDEAANLSDADASKMFGNPWRLLSVVNLRSDAYRAMNVSSSDDRILYISSSIFSMITCNTTGMYSGSKGD
jgi:hypothetical protein